MKKPTIVIEVKTHRNYSALLRTALSIVDQLRSKNFILAELTPTEEQWLQALENAIGEVDRPNLERVQAFYKTGPEETRAHNRTGEQRTPRA